MKIVLAIGLAASLLLAGAAEARGQHAKAAHHGGGHHSGGGRGAARDQSGGLGMKSPDALALGMGNKGGRGDAFSLGATPSLAQRRNIAAGQRAHHPKNGLGL